MLDESIDKFLTALDVRYPDKVKAKEALKSLVQEMIAEVKCPTYTLEQLQEMQKQWENK